MNCHAWLRVLRTGSGLCGCLLGLGVEGFAQDAERLTAIQKRLEEIQEQHAAELEFLELEIDSLGEELDLVRAKGQVPQGANVFNPEITVFGNAQARIDDRNVFLDDDPAEARLDDRFQFRELEVSFRSAIDPLADGVVILSFEAEVPGEFEAGVEEAYVDLKGLPFVEQAPLGLKLRAGRFRPEFGRFNQIHLHDLPQPSYPRALATFLGEEGYVQEGIGARFFLPAGSAANSLEANLQWLSGAGLPVAGDQGGSDLAGLGHLKFFRELNAASTLELGSSLWRSDSDHSLFGVDATYAWKPLLQGQARSFLFGGEFFMANLKSSAPGDGASGFYLWSQLQFSKSFYAGLRLDQSEALDVANSDTRTVGVFGTYYTSEFLRLRCGYEHTTSDQALLDGRNSLLFELNFIFGSHPTEPYWVNR